MNAYLDIHRNHSIWAINAYIGSIYAIDALSKKFFY